MSTTGWMGGQGQRILKENLVLYAAGTILHSRLSCQGFLAPPESQLELGSKKVGFQAPSLSQDLALVPPDPGYPGKHRESSDSLPYNCLLTSLAQGRDTLRMWSQSDCYRDNSIAGTTGRGTFKTWVFTSR